MENDFKSIWYDLVSGETKVSNKSFHGQISSSVAEERLRLVNVDRCYLSRESDVVPGKYILSCLVKGAVLHYSVPRAAYKKLVYSNFKFAECQIPVVRPDSDEKPAVITYSKRSCYGLSPRLPWWIVTYRSKYANIPKYCGNELILHSTYRFWNLLFINESDDFIWKNTSFWFQICFCLKYFIFFHYENSIFKISP